MQALIDEAAKHGATIEEDAGCVQAVAPDGFHWVDSDCYHIAMPYGADEDRTKQQAMRDGLARMKLGTRLMTEEEAQMAGDAPACEEIHSSIQINKE